MLTLIKIAALYALGVSAVPFATSSTSMPPTVSEPADRPTFNLKSGRTPAVHQTPFILSRQLLTLATANPYVYITKSYMLNRAPVESEFLDFSGFKAGQTAVNGGDAHGAQFLERANQGLNGICWRGRSVMSWISPLVVMCR